LLIAEKKYIGAVYRIEFANNFVAFFKFLFRCTSKGYERNFLKIIISCKEYFKVISVIDGQKFRVFDFEEILPNSFAGL